MAKRDFVIQSGGQGKTCLTGVINLTMRRDFVSVEELANAPGVDKIVHELKGLRNQASQAFTIILDPLYETHEEARQELERWLQRRVIHLGDSWDEQDGE